MGADEAAMHALLDRKGSDVLAVLGVLEDVRYGDAPANDTQPLRHADAPPSHEDPTQPVEAIWRLFLGLERGSGRKGI